MKKVVSFTTAKNEADIIEVFVRHNIQYVDQMFVSVNLASDGTLEILHALRDEGLNLVVWENDNPLFNQKRVTTEAYQRIARACEFDMIALLDADEFIERELRSDLERRCEPGRVLNLARYEYVYLEDLCRGESCVDRQKHRRKELQREKIVLCHDRENYSQYRIGTGNHYAYRNGVRIVGEPLEQKLGHYPYRSVDQFIEKMVMGWVGFIRADPGLICAESGIRQHWRNGYRFLTETGFHLDSERLIRYLYHVDDVESFREGLVHAGLSDRSVDIKYAGLVTKKSLVSFLLGSHEEEILARFAACSEKSRLAAENEALRRELKEGSRGYDYALKLLNGAANYAQNARVRIRREGALVEFSGGIKGVESARSCLWRSSKFLPDWPRIGTFNSSTWARTSRGVPGKCSRTGD